MKTLLASLAVLLLLELPSATVTAAPTDIPFYEGDPNFLFIGNSYTSSNNLRVMVDEIMSDGVPEWEEAMNVQAYNPGGRTLARHIDELESGSNLNQHLITNPAAWKWVVLQDQSQTPSFWEFEGPDSGFTRSLEAAEDLNDLIVAIPGGPQTMFFMTWGYRDGDSMNGAFQPDFLTMQGKLTEGYMRYNAATSTDSRPTYVAPVGLVFQTIYQDLVAQGIVPTDAGTLFHQLYSGDGSHPAVPGTYVAALTFYSSMTGRSPKDITFFPDGLDPATGRLLQDAVSRTVLETFRSGVIPYAWTTAFSTDGASPSSPTSSTPSSSPTTPPPTTSPTRTPETKVPTVTPTTASPTRNPTTAPTTDTTNNNRGSITINFVMDDYPSEVIWTMMAEGDEESPMFFQPYESGVAPGSTVSKTFDNLLPGATYLFKAQDFYADGVCCSYGEGSLTIIDNNAQPQQQQERAASTKAVLFDSTSEFQTYTELDFEILADGNTQLSGETVHYTPSTWPDFEDQRNPTSDPAWPGLMPNEPTASVMINVMMTQNPEDVSWKLLRQTDARTFVSIYEYSGVEAEPNEMASTEITDMVHGWYLLQIQDNQDAGSNQGEFASLTAPLRALQGEMGVAWGSDGFYYGKDEIFFRMQRNGLLSAISWKSPFEQ